MRSVRRLVEERRRVGRASPLVRSVAAGGPAAASVNAAECGFDGVVCGDGGRGGWGRSTGRSCVRDHSGSDGDECDGVDGCGGWAR